MMMIIMMMEGGAPRRQAIARVGKGLRIFRPSQLDFGRQLSFSPYARAVESRCWPRGGAIDCRLMACGELLARGPVCDHAGSHSFILRAKHISGSAFEEVDWVLEKSGHTRVAVS